VRLLAAYLDNARKFDRLAAEEINPILKAHFEKQADAYRKLAAERARKLGALAPPDRTEGQSV
jgi:hypothetical protein